MLAGISRFCASLSDIKSLLIQKLQREREKWFEVALSISVKSLTNIAKVTKAGQGLASGQL